MKETAVKLLLLFFLTGTGLSASGPLGETTDFGNGNQYSDWFGYFNDQNYPWIYHRDHGWVYCSDTGAAGIWLWMPGIGWSWTNQQLYPVIFEKRAGWLHYDKATSSPRSFYDYSAGEWLKEGSRGGSESYYPVPSPSENYTWLYSVNDDRAVSYILDGVRLSLRFSRCAVAFRGSDLVHTMDMSATTGSTAYVDGVPYAVSGNFMIGMEEGYESNSLGLYSLYSTAEMSLNFNIEGIEINGYTTAHAIQYNEYLMGFPWRDNLYEMPVGTVFKQVVGSGWVTGYYSIEVVGYPEDSDSGSFSEPFTGMPDVRWEIIGKEPTMAVRGRVFQQVVVIQLTTFEADPYNGSSYPATNTLWLAPGVGLVKMEMFDPMIGQSITLELKHSNLL